VCGIFFKTGVLVPYLPAGREYSPGHNKKVLHGVRDFFLKTGVLVPCLPAGRESSPGHNRKVLHLVRDFF
jgi:hypothetical protein